MSDQAIQFPSGRIPFIPKYKIFKLPIFVIQAYSKIVRYDITEGQSIPFPDDFPKFGQYLVAGLDLIRRIKGIDMTYIILSLPALSVCPPSLPLHAKLSGKLLKYPMPTRFWTYFPFPRFFHSKSNRKNRLSTDILKQPFRKWKPACLCKTSRFPFPVFILPKRQSYSQDRLSS